MDSRPLGTTGFDVSEIALGTWQLGGSWGSVTNDEAYDAIEAALDAGIDFLDTADVYGDGDSERRIGDVLADRDDDVTVATKAGRRLDPHEADGYNRENLERFVYRSRDNLGVDSLDLVQLHCPPREVYYQPEVFDALSELRDAGKIDHYGVSVEKVEEGLKAIEYDGVETVQIIFNPLRQRPAELFFREAARRNVGVIVRVPLASGLLTGALSADAEFAENDHRNFNRHGEAFDVGETFAGIPFEDGLEAADSIQEVVPEGVSLAQFTLRWILSFDAVSTVIPGSKTPEHIRDNVAAASLPPLSADQFERVEEVYNAYAREHVHHRW
ncbi:aldo/keto reductase [Haloferax volcanii]|uniref:Oxidoreductase (Aldo-keto reductase family protein) n=3 Tax=Haloferax volcanii TaxID=2246 RepID=D4GSI0_HALVD|nr:aldo/keto reductase [Haloferax volcanii]ADE03845.1 putative oxidoreductase (aldo-keto reductase family protein) [Haloferax volcanii DS2]ELY26155.1 putative oxidoreductase [Haloferax volcanii DS2]MBS8119860.1 aldo/keto reductase [Haloferax volcanii]MBS8124872.1 aldo/keto reductase [Haloferax volcanii]MBS8128935.1 aldo/keto reductase [Haloferax volcanii]